MIAPGFRRERDDCHNKDLYTPAQMTMSNQRIAELWEWAEYYCPWCYVTAVRLHQMQPEFAGRVTFSTRFFPIEFRNGEGPPRDILEQEWWLAAIQEPAASFVPFNGSWPTTTLPAFDVVWAARRQSNAVAMELDLRIRRAFFGESQDIGNRNVVLEIARDMDLDFSRLESDSASPNARAAVAEEGLLGRERYHVRGTPTLMLADGARLHTPLAMPRMRDRKIVSMSPMTCFGPGCASETRALFDAALALEAALADDRDTVADSTIDTFPASDSPSWSPLRLGAP